MKYLKFVTPSDNCWCEATALREKEAASFAPESTELKTNFAAFSKAITAVENAMSGSFLQSEDANVLKNGDLIRRHVGCRSF